MTIPCVIALPLDAAQRLLRDAGVSAIGVTRTGPPRGGPIGVLRIIRQRATDAGVELVTSASVSLADREACHD